MPYYRRTTKAGNTLIIEKGYRRGQAVKIRSGKERPTKEAVKKYNETLAVRKLTALMNENFRKDDLHLTLTYKIENRPAATEAKKCLNTFIRRLRGIYKKAEKELKYVHTTEYKRKAIHHHILVNYHDLREIKNCWEFGTVRPTFIYTHNLKKLAEYFVKETKKTFRESGGSRQRYVPSRNLKRPEPKEETMKRNRWNSEPEEKKGYYIDRDSTESGVNEITGQPYQYVIYVRLQAEEKLCRKL